MMNIVLVGNPNCGKSTLFNGLTRSRQRVGNWPGVTVEKKTGHYVHAGTVHEIIDLPGIYSMQMAAADLSPDERITQEYLLSGRPDLIVNVVNASSLARGLFLTTELLDLDIPVIIALNMMDTANSAGVQIDHEQLQKLTGCPVVPMIANRSRGMDELGRLLVEGSFERPPWQAKKISLGKWDTEILRLQKTLSADGFKMPRFHAITLIQGATSPLSEQFAATASTSMESYSRAIEQIVQERHAWVARWVSAVTHHRKVRRSLTELLDAIFLHRWLAFPLFLGIIYLVFFVSINIGGALIDMFDGIAGALVISLPRWLLVQIGSPEWLIAFVADGLGGGIQLVASFIPIIGTLFICLVLLEDSGYMARVAFILDRLMIRIGLPGKAFIPLIIGFGCNVPAVMATRNLHDGRDRLLTTIMAPFMSCGARLTVYALFAAAFFPDNGQNVVFSLYLVGIALAVLSGLVIRRFILEKAPSMFLMELPAYHRPTFRGTFIQAWQRLKGFIFRAGKAIVLVVVVLNLMSSYGTDGSFNNQNRDNSLLAETGRMLTPIFAPMGVTENNWPATVGIFTGIFAKEVVVGTLDSLYTAMASEPGKLDRDDEEAFNLGEELLAALATVPENIEAALESYDDILGLSIIEPSGLAEAAREQEVQDNTFKMIMLLFDGQLGAFSYLLFILIYIPCIATLGAIYREWGGFWAFFSTLWSLSLAYIVAVMVYQAGQLAVSPGSALIWLVAMTGSLVAIHSVLILLGRRQANKQRLIPVVNLSA